MTVRYPSVVRVGRRASSRAAYPTAMAPNGCQSGGTASACATTSGQKTVDETHAVAAPGPPPRS